MCYKIINEEGISVQKILIILTVIYGLLACAYPLPVEGTDKTVHYSVSFRIEVVEEDRRYLVLDYTSEDGLVTLSLANTGFKSKKELVDFYWYVCGFYGKPDYAKWNA